MIVFCSRTLKEMAEEKTQWGKEKRMSKENHVYERKEAPFNPKKKNYVVNVDNITKKKNQEKWKNKQHNLMKYHLLPQWLAYEH